MFILGRFLLLVCWLPCLYVRIDIVYSVFFYLLRINGPFFIKLAQLYTSVYDDSRMSACVFDNINAHSYDETKRIYEASFGGKLVDAYTDVRMIASGSIGQVYEATDVNTHQKVAIKVRHPDIHAFSTQQIALLRRVLKCMFRLSIIDVDAFIQSYVTQIDMQVEAQNMLRFGEQYAHVPFVTFPTPLRWSSDILVMTHHAGVQKKAIMHDSYTFRKVSLMLFVLVRSMAFENGFLHCDLHPGNWSYDHSRRTLNVYDTGTTTDVDVTLVHALFTHLYDNEMVEALTLFMVHMLSVPLSEDKIQRWIRNNPDDIDILRNNTSGRNILNVFRKCAVHHRSTIKTDMVFLLLSNIAVENVLKINDIVAVDQKTCKQIAKDELTMCKDLFPQYEAFLRRCIRTDTSVYETDSVMDFYNLKNNGH